MLCERSNKQISTQKVKNLITKLVPKSSTHDRNLEDCLESLDMSGDTVQFTYDPEGCVDSLFISSAERKKKFAEHDLVSIQMDTTFNTEGGQYKLVAFCYYDMSINKTEEQLLRLSLMKVRKSFILSFLNWKIKIAEMVIYFLSKRTSPQSTPLQVRLQMPKSYNKCLMFWNLCGHSFQLH